MATTTKKTLTPRQRRYGAAGSIAWLILSVFLLPSGLLPPIGLYLSLFVFAPIDQYHLASGGDPDASIAGIAIMVGFVINTIIYAIIGWFVTIKLTKLADLITRE